MTRRERTTRSRWRGAMSSGLALTVLLSAFSAADAQTRAAVDSGPAAPASGETDSPVDEPAQAPAAAQDARPDGFTIGGFTFRLGGRIKLDIIRDFNPIGSEDSFDPRTIPLDDSKGGNSQLHARETRLTIDVRGDVEGKELRMYVETDFYGSGNVLRLRQAYGSWGGLLAGQAWSTFVDDANFPNTIDFESPMAFPSIRQAQLRWTQKLTPAVTWSAAVEDNKSTIVLPDEPGEAEYPMPDLATHVRFNAARGHAFASAFLGRARFRPADGSDPDDQTLWGFLLSGRVKTIGSDYAYGQLTFGDGVGRYRGGVTAVPDASGELHAPGLVGIMGGYEHYWTPRLTSNFVMSHTSGDEEDFYSPDTNTGLGYTAVNLIYWFLPNRAWAGVEYLHGSREVFSGAEGSADRLQFAVRFNLP